MSEDITEAKSNLLGIDITMIPDSKEDAQFGSVFTFPGKDPINREIHADGSKTETFRVTPEELKEIVRNDILMEKPLCSLKALSWNKKYTTMDLESAVEVLKQSNTMGKCFYFDVFPP